ncbi:MAG: hypothetical protein HQL60_00755 [Magnetococcales bacterium]|nr:hypothetical protein [Magnetococcales bacterium]
MEQFQSMVVCEPLCKGDEHTGFNAAMLLSLRCAYPETKILFLSEESHWRILRGMLEANGMRQQAETLTWRAIVLPQRNLSNKWRVPYDWRVVKTVYQQAAELGSPLVLFLSASSATLYSIKFKCRGKTQSWIVMHGAVDDLRKACFRAYKPFYYGNALLLGNKSDIHYLVLGRYIADWLPRFASDLASYVVAIDHPGIFLTEREKDSNELPSLSRPCFGSIGVVAVWKGSESFLRLAESVYRRLGPGRASFHFIGAMIDNELGKRIAASPSVEPVGEVCSGSFMPREQLDRAIQSIDYAVFLYPTDSYVLKASGAIIDAFRFAKPILAIRCVMFEYYFSMFGDIGYLCEDEAELQKMVERLILAPEPDRYQQQRETMLRQRVHFGVEASANRLKILLNTK